MHANCPVCCEFLFDSIKPINIMLCGHTIHQVWQAAKLGECQCATVAAAAAAPLLACIACSRLGKSGGQVYTHPS